MKVLWLSKEQPVSYASRLHTGLRQRIGTCEALSLSIEQQQNLEDFFTRFVRLSQYDRILLEFPQSLIYQQSHFLRRLPHLSVLSLGERYSAKEKRYLRKNLSVMPWMRFIGDDCRLVKALVEKGYDAYWIYPTFNPDHYWLHRKLRGQTQCVIFDPNNELKSFHRRQIGAFQLRFLKPNEDLAGILRAEDLFIYWPKTPERTPLPMIQAMACGALVITPDPGVKMRVRYRWRDHENCIFANDPHSAFETAAILSDHPHMLHELAKKSHEDVQRFFPQPIGFMLGGALEPKIRLSEDYPKKIRIFGFEF
ncbi:glycosyltransferase [Suttonella ornithocola]|uniref:Glycosyl transferases group 1 n=1 Tax=Suttonella ornithocola TaxID=279832 RepID=A0A380MXX4_9GAMM|nr:hypothetical protein [Suttonella ornithocola]SUO97409.1 Uncharacterised protein [Suttonella ornithocola]